MKNETEDKKVRFQFFLEDHADTIQLSKIKKKEKKRLKPNPKEISLQRHKYYGAQCRYKWYEKHCNFIYLSFSHKLFVPNTEFNLNAES